MRLDGLFVKLIKQANCIWYIAVYAGNRSPEPEHEKPGSLMQKSILNQGSLQNELRKNTADRSPKGFPIRGVCVKIESVKNNSKTQDQCTVYERNGQLVLALNNEILLPENAPVRLTSAQLEELDYRELYRAYSPKGGNRRSTRACCSR